MVLLEQIHERTGYRTDVLEKDYYVVLMLRELAEKQKAGLPAYFKGGTALYKALKTTNRFPGHFYYHFSNPKRADTVCPDD